MVFFKNWESPIWVSLMSHSFFFLKLSNTSWFSLPSVSNLVILQSILASKNLSSYNENNLWNIPLLPIISLYSSVWCSNYFSSSCNHFQKWRQKNPKTSLCFFAILLLYAEILWFYHPTLNYIILLKIKSKLCPIIAQLLCSTGGITNHTRNGTIPRTTWKITAYKAAVAKRWSRFFFLFFWKKVKSTKSESANGEKWVVALGRGRARWRRTAPSVRHMAQGAAGAGNRRLLVLFISCATLISCPCSSTCIFAGR